MDDAGDTRDAIDPGPAPAPPSRDRCQAETTVGGNRYACALQDGHDGEHAFQPADSSPEPPDAAEEDPASRSHRLAVERWDKYLVKNLTEEYGEERFALLAKCPLCQYTDTPGHVVLQRPPDEVVSVVRQVLNIKDPSKLHRDPHSQVCAECGGEGEVGTDSKVAGQEALICGTCKGRGWTPTDDVRQAGYIAPAAAIPAGNGDAGPPELPSAGVTLPPEAEHLRRLGYVVVPPS